MKYVKNINKYEYLYKTYCVNIYVKICKLLVVNEYV